MGLFSKFTGGSKTKAPAAKPSPVARTPMYRGVQIVTKSADCCDAARSITGKKFLDTAAPKLPLSDCDAQQCECAYRRFDDRRADLRRTADFAFDIASEIREQENLRDTAAKGRRQDD